jgi:hypothetical protein
MSAEYKLKILELAAFYEKTLTDEQVRVYSEFLAQRMSIHELTHAIALYCDDATNEFFPRPISKLVALIHSPIDDESVAKESAARIVAAIPKFGWCNREDAKAFIGEVGWAVVEKQGGWQYICEHYGKEISMSTFQAQARDLAKSQIVLAKRGLADSPPALPQAKVMEMIPQSHSEKQKQLAGMIKNLNEVIK